MMLNSILIATVSCYIFADFHGGSKPPPYNVVICTVSFATAFGCLSLTMQLLLFRKNHAWLACSVVNALSTAHCRYQLLRIADRDNLRSHIFSFLIKHRLPLTREPKYAAVREFNKTFNHHYNISFAFFTYLLYDLPIKLTEVKYAF